MSGKKKLICFFVIFLLVNAFGLAENEKIQTEKSWESENYVALENENNRNLKSDNDNNEKKFGLKKDGDLKNNEPVDTKKKKKKV